VVIMPAGDQHTLTQVRGVENLRQGVMIKPVGDQQTFVAVCGV
jgi:hypothetical protein